MALPWEADRGAVGSQGVSGIEPNSHLLQGHQVRAQHLPAIHLENLLKLARLGVRIVPPIPAFYTHPRDLDDVVVQVVGRALLALGVPGSLDTRYICSGLGASDDTEEQGANGD